VSVSQLVRSNPTANAGGMSRRVKLDTDPGGRTRPSASRAAEHAEQRADRQARTHVEPGIELFLIPSSE
jgi:hypothetical protein